MASSSYSSMFVLSVYLVFLLRLTFAESQIELAPALYVFGDSIVDSGNNNFLKTKAKSNSKPYGIDFHGGATGRFTNGNTFVDYIAKLLGLPDVPPYLGVSACQRSKITTGLNYASGGAGIFPETGTALGDILSMDEQINYFQNTVKNDLPKSFKTQENLSYYLSKSIFVVVVGINDYLNNFLQPDKYESSKNWTEEEFSEILLNGIEERLIKLYNLGARKLVVFEIGPIGCLPGVVNSVKPKPESPCFENLNNLINIYNAGLPSKIQSLNTILKGSTFVRGEIFQPMHVINQNPSKFGFTSGRTPCCVVGGNGTTGCLPNQTPCQDRTKHIFWDAYHMTQEVNRRIANDCFRGSSLCVPINIQQLAQKQ